MPILPQLNLDASPYKGVAMKQQDYKIAPIDFSLLEKALDKQEARHNAANTQYNAVQVALGAMREKLYENPENMEWFDNFSKNIEDQIKGHIATGDYAGALTVATRLGGEAASDKEAISRIKYSAEVKEHDKKREALVANTKISDASAKYDEVINGFNFQPEKDEQGNVIGYKPYRETKALREDLDYLAVIERSMKNIVPTTSSYGTSEIKEDDTKDADGNTTGYTITDKTTGVTYKVTRKELEDDIMHQYENNAILREQVDFNYNAELKALCDKKKEFDEKMKDPSFKNTREYKDACHELELLEAQFSFYEKDANGNVQVIGLKSGDNGENGDNELRKAFYLNKVKTAFTNSLAKTNSVYKEDIKHSGLGKGKGSSGNGGTEEKVNEPHTEANLQGSVQSSTIIGTK